jgi:hypothetical protein
MVNHLFTEGTVPVPPNRPLRFAIVSYYLLWNYRFKKGVPQRGGGGIICRSPKKSVKRNILRISTEPTIPEIPEGFILITGNESQKIAELYCTATCAGADQVCVKYARMPCSLTVSIRANPTRSNCTTFPSSCATRGSQAPVISPSGVRRVQEIRSCAGSHWMI